MQLLGDALTVLGSRLGLSWDPVNKKAYLIRHGNHPGIPLEIRAGIRIGNNEIVLPLTNEGTKFEFCDQETTATSMTLGGIDPTSAIHVKLNITIPFRPRDNFFSTIPAIYIDFKVDRLVSHFRWTGQPEGIVNGVAFLEIKGEGFEMRMKSNGFDVKYKSPVVRPRENYRECEREDRNYLELIDCTDRLECLKGEIKGNRIEADFSLDRGIKGPAFSMVWCAYDEPVLEVFGKACRFKYTNNFKNLDEVITWARENEDKVKENSSKVDKLLSSHTLGDAITKLMAQTLHSWLMNTWWVVRENNQDWFTVWEGCCYFHSTVDVEYTQAPFYLAIWPELLEYQLNEWALFGKSGVKCLGEKGEGMIFLSHDIGKCGKIDKQYYNHDMAVEESTNYLLLAYTHWHRTGNDSIVSSHYEFMKGLMNFLVASDTTGNGIPDKGCANTIDDASPAIQFGVEQVYLGVKAVAAVQVGIEMLKKAGYKSFDLYEKFVSTGIETIETKGWMGDHYAVTLTNVMNGIVDPWTGKEFTGELEGWDAYHIYTQNGLALLDMIGYNTGLNNDRLTTDIQSALKKTNDRFGCRHTSYVNPRPSGELIPGMASVSPKVGWISMNMLRDIAAAYRGIDCFSMADKYWNWQCTTNSQQITMFFETFYGNNLHFYPRGIAIFGYFDAAAGFAYDTIKEIMNYAPVRGGLEVPILIFADWEKGTAPKVVTSLKEGKIVYSIV